MFPKYLFLVTMVQIISSSVLLLLINGSTNSTAIVRHCIKFIQKVAHKVKLGRITKTTAHQPGYILLKQIQWKLSNSFGEDVFTTMMDGLYIEMAMITY